MSKSISIVAATKADAADLAILDDIASHGLALWFWQGAVKMGKAENAMEWGRSRMADDQSVLGYRNYRVARQHGRVIGAAAGFIQEKGRADAEKDIPVLQPIIKLLERCDGHWILESLAVYANARGQGVGANLLDNCFERAKTAQASTLSLIAEEGNDPALELYFSRSLREISREKYVPFNDNNTTENWLLLSASL